MEDLQSLLEKINRDGVEKAEAEAKKILSAAEQKAADIVAQARVAAQKARAEAERDAAAYAAHAAETVKQSARDIIIGVEDALAALLDKLLAQNVERALADSAASAKLAAEALSSLVRADAAEIAAAPQIAATLKAQLASQPEIRVVVDETLGTGFTIRLDNGRVEHDFTAKALADELAKRLRPDLAKLLK